MPRLSAHRRTIYLIAKAFAGGLALTGLGGAGGCSDGESGLVLGRIPPEPAMGGTSAAAGGGGQANAGQAGDAGHAGAVELAGAGGETGGVGTVTDNWIDEKCTPTLTFANRDMTSQGQLFDDTVPDPALLVWQATRDACRVLYRFGSEVKSVSDVTLIVEDYAGIASTSGTAFRLSTRYLQAQYDAGADLQQEIAGIMHFVTSLVYQYNGSDTTPGWLMTGIADFVRLKSGFIDRAERSKGGNYDSSSRATAFFLDYLATRNPSVVYELNLRLAPGEPAYTDELFVSLMGSDLQTLWAQYQATL